MKRVKYFDTNAIQLYIRIEIIRVVSMSQLFTGMIIYGESNYYFSLLVKEWTRERKILKGSSVTGALTSKSIHPGKFSAEPIRSQESYFLVNNK